MTEYAADWVRDVDGRFGQRVRAERERRRISQQQMVIALAEAHELRWHQTTATRVENGERPVRLFEALAIANVLDVSLDDLLDDPDSPATRRRRSQRLQGQLAELDQMTGHIALRTRALEDELIDVDPDEAAARGLIDQDDANNDGEDANDGEHRPSP